LSDGQKKEIYQYIQFFHGALQMSTNQAACTHLADSLQSHMLILPTVTA